MKVAKIKSEKPFRTTNNRSLGIQNYGEGNAFPQKTIEIVAASGTGTACLDIYSKFIIGAGLSDPELRDMLVNSRRETLDAVVRAAATDLARFNGFALHVNYDATGHVSSLAHVPFEHCRFGAIDRETKRFDKIAVHPDWAGQYKDVLPFSKEDIDFIDLYDPRAEVVESQVREAGGIESYKGQILYYSGDGYLVYPAPKYVAVITDMRTEEGVANVLARNACSSFLPGGLLVEYLHREQDDEQLSALQKSILSFQGDENAGKILCAQVSNAEEKPEFISFAGTNYDKEFTATLAAVQDNIGRAFEQPPILRAKDVGANLGAELITNAYHLYNSITSDERAILADVFTKILEHWWEPLPEDAELRIQPLVFGTGDTLVDRVGKENADKIVSLAIDANVPDDNKRGILRAVYGLTEEEIEQIVPNYANQTL